MAAFSTRNLFAGLDQMAPPIWPLIGLAAAGGLTLAALVASKAIAAHIGHSYARDLRLALYEVAAREPVSAPSRRRPGASSLRFVGDLGAIRGWVGTGLAEAITSATVLPVSLAILWAIHPGFMPAGLGMIAAVGCATALVTRRFPKLHRDLRRARSRMAADLSERLRHAPRLDLLGRRDTDLDLIRAHSDRVQQLSVTRARRQAWLGALPDFSAVLGGVACAAVALDAELAAADLAAALAVLGLVLAPLRSLSTLTGRHAAFMVARRACLVALSRPSRHLARPMPDDGTDGMEPNAALSVAGADRAVEVLRGARHCLAETSARAVQSILQGDRPAPQGWIRLGNRDLARMDQSGLRRHVRLVDPNDPILRGSLRRALTLGISPRPTDALLEEALDRYGLRNAAPNGLATRVSEDGQSLSAAQRAGLRLARAALSQSDAILVCAAQSLAWDAGCDRIAAFMADAPGAVLFDAQVSPDLEMIDFPPPPIAETG